MKRFLLPFLALALIAGLAIIFTGVLGGSQSIATVNGTKIEKSTYDHWFNAVAKAQVAPGQPPIVPDAPNFTKCIKTTKVSLPKKAPEGQKLPTTAEIKSQCKTLYDELHKGTLQFLISTQWLLDEAKELNVSVSDDEVNKAFETAKKQQFPNQKDYQDFLKRTGFTQEDLLINQKLTLLSTKIQAKIPQGEPVTDQEINDYYNANKDHFNGQTLDQAKPSIQQTLTADHQQKAQAKFVDDFTNKFRQKTECAKDFIIEDCKNGSKKNTN